MYSVDTAEILIDETEDLTGILDNCDVTINDIEKSEYLCDEDILKFTETVETLCAARKHRSIRTFIAGVFSAISNLSDDLKVAQCN